MLNGNDNNDGGNKGGDGVDIKSNFNKQTKESFCWNDRNDQKEE